MISVTCIECSVEKPVSEYYKKTASTKGIRSVCKACCSKRTGVIEKEKVTCGRCGIEHFLWRSKHQKRAERKHPNPTACEDCYERASTTDWGAVWDYYAKLKGITN